MLRGLFAARRQDLVPAHLVGVWAEACGSALVYLVAADGDDVTAVEVLPTLAPGSQAQRVALLVAEQVRYFADLFAADGMRGAARTLAASAALASHPELASRLLRQLSNACDLMGLTPSRGTVLVNLAEALNQNLLIASAA